MQGIKKLDGDELTDLEKTIFLAQLDRLLPSVVAFVEVSGDASELDQLVLLQTGIAQKSV